MQNLMKSIAANRKEEMSKQRNLRIAASRKVEIRIA
jgi:hypothetical protein